MFYYFKYLSMIAIAFVWFTIAGPYMISGSTEAFIAFFFVTFCVLLPFYAREFYYDMNRWSQK